MSFLSKSKEVKKEVETTPEIRLAMVSVAGQWVTHLFIAGKFRVDDNGFLVLTHPHGGVTWYAPGIWSTVQTYALSEECQQLIRGYVKTQNFDYIVEEKLRKSDL